MDKKTAKKIRDSTVPFKESELYRTKDTTMVPGKGSRTDLIDSIMRNITKKDMEMSAQGYIPISWLLAKLTYTEATIIVKYNDAIERTMIRYGVK